MVIRVENVACIFADAARVFIFANFHSLVYVKRVDSHSAQA